MKLVIIMMGFFLMTEAYKLPQAQIFPPPGPRTGNQVDDPQFYTSNFIVFSFTYD